MTVLSRIRNNIGLVVTIIAIALLAFILTDLFSGLSGRLNAAPNAGVVAGKEISAIEFSERYQSELQRYGSLGESQSANIMDMVWNTMVSDIAFDKELETVGLEVSGEELKDMFTGQNIHPIVQQYFVQPGEQPNPANIQRQLETILNDPQGREQLKILEDYLAKERAREIYSNMIRAAFVGSNALGKETYVEQTRKANIEFVGINYSQIPDSSVKVSDKDLKAYLDRYANKYKQEEATYIDFVKYDIIPSKADSAEARKRVLSKRVLFAESTNDSLFVAGQSSMPFNNQFVSLSQIPEGLKDSIGSKAVKSVVGPVRDNNYFKLYKVVDKRESTDSYIRVNHILITPEGVTKADTLAARDKAAALLKQTNKDNFASMVSQNSLDFSTRNNGGNMGWYGKSGRYGEGFYNSIKNLNAGSISGPIKSNSGYHIVQILDKTNAEFKIAEIEEEIYASSETRDQVYGKVNELADLAKNILNDLDSAAAQMNYQSTRSNALMKNTKIITGLDGGRKLILWALKAQKGEFSEVEQIGESFVYAQVVEKRAEGVQDLEEARPLIFQQVLNEKKARIIIDKLKSAAAGSTDLQAIKNAYGAGAFISNANDITVQSPSIPGIGSDPLIAGKVSVMKAGDVSAPIQGVNGIFIVKVLNVVDAPELDENGLKERKEMAIQQGKNLFASSIQPALIKISNVKDERYKAGF